MLGLFHGVPGARAWRRILTVGAVRPGAGIEVVQEALAAVTPSPSVEAPSTSLAESRARVRLTDIASAVVVPTATIRLAPSPRFRTESAVRRP